MVPILYSNILLFIWRHASATCVGGRDTAAYEYAMKLTPGVGMYE